LLPTVPRAAPEPGHDPLFGDGPGITEVFDPMEPMNRLVSDFNQGLDTWVLDPVTGVYDLVVPAPARKALRRALFNLDAPAVFVNDVLQLEPADAGLTATRFAINTVFGACGLLDVAALLGLEGHQSDFGQTMALYGMPSGPYLVLPVLGPTTVRDGTGFLVDFWFRPTTYFLTPLSNVVFTSIRDGTAGLAALDAHGPALDALEASAMDYYAALRSAYMQDREGQIWRRRPRPRELSRTSD
jgi:phospholipid-binding lipoprotein MlaA